MRSIERSSSYSVLKPTLYVLFAFNQIRDPKVLLDQFGREGQKAVSIEELSVELIPNQDTQTEQTVVLSVDQTTHLK